MNYIILDGTFIKWTYKITIPDETFDIEYGSFEYWDDETNGYDDYEEGQLIFEDGEFFDFDGVSTLPDFIIKEIAKHRKINL